MDVLHASVTGLVQVFAWPTFGLILPPGQRLLWLGYVVEHRA